MSIPSHNARNDPFMAKLRKGDAAALVIGGAASFLTGFWIAPAFEGGGLSQTLEFIRENDMLFRLTRPSLWEWSPTGLKAAVLCLAIYLGVMFFVITEVKNRRSGEEYGSAQWANNRTVNERYSDGRHPLENRLLTQNVAISYDTHAHQRNLNTLVIGGSGAGKTRNYTKPNVYNCNTSLVLTDPSGEVLQSCGHLYEERGYELQVFDINKFENSMHYNPFAYIREEKDIDQLVTVLIRSTTPPRIASKDPFWENAEKTLISALMFYLWKEAPVCERNFPTLIRLLGMLKADNRERSRIDEMMFRLPPEHMARKRYEAYRIAAKDTAASIIISVNVRLEPLSLTTVEDIMRDNEIDIEALGRKKTALFCIISDEDTTFNCIAAMLFTQIFRVLYDQADHNGSRMLDVPVHMLMEEAANIAMPEDFTSILSTMRKRNITCSVVYQDISQIEARFGKEWESVLQNCDELLYLGGNSERTFEYISKLLGKETIDIQNTSKTEGWRGSYSVNRQRTGRELLTPDEVRTIRNTDAILFIRGEDPVLDRKYDISTHPNCRYTLDGKGDAFYYPSYVDRYRDERRPVFGTVVFTESERKELEEAMKNLRFL
ncbi:MAG: type IV secretory system conjugative DNA transfer family protein [Eubacteriaceae bacterium]|nr:type IV secretory system conjugative DNA transfer family protein [Eubacteriaceae bacterium]